MSWRHCSVLMGVEEGEEGERPRHLLLQEQQHQEILQRRGFPSSLTPPDTRVWLQLESSLLVLLAFMFQLRDEYCLMSQKREEQKID